MNEVEFVKRFPRLYHMAEDGSWPGIEVHGLLSASSLADLYELNRDDRRRLLEERRPRAVPLNRAGLPRAVLRDNIPMTDEKLRQCLQGGLKPTDWYQILNAMTFFWLSKSRVKKLLGARAYRHKPNIVLTIDTAAIFRHHRDKIKLSPINSGATLFKPVARGLETFQPLNTYPFAARRGRELVVELCVAGGIHDIKEHTLVVQRWNAAATTDLWRSEEAIFDDGI